MLLRIASQNKLFLSLLFLFSFSLNLAYLFFFTTKTSHFVCQDSSQYDSLAKQIYDNNGIVDANGQPAISRVPGYSFFLAGCYKIFGYNHERAMILQSFLASMIPVLTFLLSLILFPNVLLLAKISAYFMAMSNGLMLYASMVMSEVVFTVFFLLFLLFFILRLRLFCSGGFKENASGKIFFLAGLFLGIASLIRPVGHFLIIAALFLLLLSSFDLAKKLKYMVLLLVAWGLFVLPWLLRSYLLTGSILFHTMPGNHFLDFLALESISYARQWTFGETKVFLEKEVAKEYAVTKIPINEKNSAARDMYIKLAVAKKYILMYPMQTIERCFANILKTIFGLNVSFVLHKLVKFPSYGGKTSFIEKIVFFLFPCTNDKFIWCIVYFELLWLIVLLLGFGGFLVQSFFNTIYLCNCLKILPFIAVMLFLSLGSGFARLRVPIEPLMIIFSMHFWLNFLSAGRLKH